MDKDTLIQEIAWEYDYTLAEAKQIVETYESQEDYDALCALVIAKKEVRMTI